VLLLVLVIMRYTIKREEINIVLDKCQPLKEVLIKLQATLIILEYNQATFNAVLKEMMMHKHCILL